MGISVAHSVVACIGDSGIGADGVGCQASRSGVEVPLEGATNGEDEALSWDSMDGGEVLYWISVSTILFWKFHGV